MTIKPKIFLESGNDMNRFNELLVVFMIIMTSCGKTQIPQDTGVLSERTQKIVDYFINEYKRDVMAKESQLEVICNYNETYSNIVIYCHDTIYKPYGKYNGSVYYKGQNILLFGDSWNNFFWTCDTIYNLPDMNPEEWTEFYDPPMWDIYISCKDTTLIERYCEFGCPHLSSIPCDEYFNIICDSLTKIIHP